MSGKAGGIRMANRIWRIHPLYLVKRKAPSKTGKNFSRIILPRPFVFGRDFSQKRAIISLRRPRKDQYMLCIQ
jgi:hypothetical protein